MRLSSLTGSAGPQITLTFILLANPGAAGADRISDLISRGDTLLAQQQFKKARSAFREAARLSPEGSFPATLGLARVALGLGDSRQAEKTAKRAIELASRPAEHAAGYNFLGLAQYRKGLASGLIRFTGNGEEEPTRQGRKVEATFRKVVDLDGEELAVAHYNLAEVLYLLDQVTEAQAQIERYLTLAGPVVKPDEKQLAECLDGVIELDPSDPDSSSPTVVSSRNPSYSEDARRRRIEGSVAVVAVIDENGRLICPRVAKTLTHGLTQTTLEALTHWEFEPARVQGKPVKVRYAVETRFDVHTR